MRQILVACSFFMFGSLFSQTKHTVSGNDFKTAIGFWKGSLTYLDYSSGKSYTMPANITLSVYAVKADAIIFAFVYPNEPKANGNDTLLISKNGTEMDEAIVTVKQKLADGSLQIITEKQGVDGNDNRKAVLRHIYTISKTIFKNRKEVRFDGEEKWILRNEYSFSR